jgi:hypothetical protein
MVVLAVWATPALADVGAQPWDGSSPFACTLQNAASLSDANADPFCVEYDHAGSSPTDAEAQLVALLTDGPNQLSAASSKCALYRVDRFTGPLYEFDSAMFVNKAAGTGGSALTKVTINGLPAPPSAIPGLPGNLGSVVGVPVVQACGSQGQSGGGGGTTAGGFLPGLGGSNPGTTAQPRPGTRCRNLSGNANNGLGRAKLGLKRATIGRRLGKPTRRARGFYHYCLRRGGDLAIHFGKGSKADVAMVSGKSFHAGKVRIGSRLARVRTSLRHEQVLGHRKRDWVFGVTHRRWRLLVGLSKNRVVYIAAVSRKLSFAKLGKILTNAGR